jgi:hypothetical protein
MVEAWRKKKGVSNWPKKSSPAALDTIRTRSQVVVEAAVK